MNKRRSVAQPHVIAVEGLTTHEMGIPTVAMWGQNFERCLSFMKPEQAENLAAALKTAAERARGQIGDQPPILVNFGKPS